MKNSVVHILAVILGSIIGTIVGGSITSIWLAYHPPLPTPYIDIDARKLKLPDGAPVGPDAIRINKD